VNSITLFIGAATCFMTGLIFDQPSMLSAAGVLFWMGIAVNPEKGGKP